MRNLPSCWSIGWFLRFATAIQWLVCSKLRSRESWKTCFLWEKFPQSLRALEGDREQPCNAIYQLSLYPWVQGFRIVCPVGLIGAQLSLPWMYVMLHSAGDLWSLGTDLTGENWGKKSTEYLSLTCVLGHWVHQSVEQWTHMNFLSLPFASGVLSEDIFCWSSHPSLLLTPAEL